MLAINQNKAATVLGEGRTRLIIFALLAFFASCYVLKGHVPLISEALVAMSGRSEAMFSSAFTFLAIFWAAMLTIWSLMKSRATRYIERLTDNAIFRRFLRDLELRLLAGFVSIVGSFGMYIANPNVTAASVFGLLLLWAFFWLAAVVLLIDSILTARVVLD